MRFLPVTMAALAFSASALTGPAWGQAPQSSPSMASGQPTLQQDFNTATQAQLDGKCDQALPIFTRLAADPRLLPGKLVTGAVAVRRGSCLVETGRYEEGAAAIEAGLPILEKAGPDFIAEVSRAHDQLGTVAMLSWRNADAIAHFKAALAPQAGTDRLTPLLRLAQATSFDGGPAPLAYIDEALRIAAAQPKPDKATLATLRGMRGRILMNQGRAKEAVADLRVALDLSGGLTARVSLSGAAMRGDLAQAYLLTGDKDNARLYLAYTGAGRIRESPFVAAANMEPPPCGAVTGLRPEDSAVVEFGIADNGDVSAAQTVYSRGNAAVAAAFGKAVSEWYWLPEDVAKVPAFYRLLTRVELRCSTRGGDVPAVHSPLQDRFREWAAGKLPVEPNTPGAVGATLDSLGQLADARERAGDLPAAVAALGLQALIEPKPSPATLSRLDRALALGAGSGVPQEQLNVLRVLRGIAADYLAKAKRQRRGFNQREFNAEMFALASDRQIAADPLARNTATLLAIPQRPSAEALPRAREVLAGVADDARLGANHPLRQIALLELADLAVADGNLAAAQGFFQRTGLDEQQCALIGVKPALRASGVSSADFPLEALQMGFEGWVKLEFDIAADGKTTNARPVIAYPPFVFVDAARGMAKDFRYMASYRPAGGTACSANRETLKFVIPSNH